MKKKMILKVLAIMLMIALVGCGVNSNEVKDSSTTVSQTVEKPEKEDTRPNGPTIQLDKATEGNLMLNFVVMFDRKDGAKVVNYSINHPVDDEDKYQIMKFEGYVDGIEDGIMPSIKYPYDHETIFSPITIERANEYIKFYNDNIADNFPDGHSTYHHDFDTNENIFEQFWIEVVYEDKEENRQISGNIMENEKMPEYVYELVNMIEYDIANPPQEMATTEDVVEEEETFEYDAWINKFDWSSLETFENPKNFSICDIEYPITFDKLVNSGIYVVGSDVEKVDEELHRVCTSFDDVIGVENSYIPSYSIGKSIDEDKLREKRDLNAEPIILNGENKTGLSLGELVYVNVESGADLSTNESLAFDKDSKFCLTIQYPPTSPHILNVDGYDYVSGDIEDGWDYYESWQLWLEALLKNNLGKPTKIYGMYTPDQVSNEKVTREDGTVWKSNNYIQYGDTRDPRYEAKYKLVWEYSDSAIVFEIIERFGYNGGFNSGFKHTYKFYSMELYDSLDSYKTMATYLDKNCVDVTNDILK